MNNQFITMMYATYPPTPLASESLDVVRQNVIDEVNKRAGDSRALFLTNIAGQEITYVQKAQDAHAYVSASMASGSITNSDFPWVYQEVAHSSASMMTVAMDIINTETQWKSVGSYLEGLRRGAITRIKTETNINTMVQIVESIPWPSP